MSPHTFSFAAVLLLAGALACGDRPPTTAPSHTAAPRTAPRPTAVAPPEQLARALALALGEPEFRAYVKGQLDASPFREHKLHFQRFLGANGNRALQALARGSGAAASDVAQRADSTIPLELYLPVPEHRRSWAGDYIAPPPPPPGLYMTQAHFVDDFEGWLKGSPEFEVHVLGQKDQTDSLKDYQCAGERQPSPYYFDQNDLDWSGSVMLYSKTQLDNYHTTHPGQDVRVFVVEDDDTACEIKTTNDFWQNVVNAVDGANQALTAGKDTTSSTADKTWKFAKAIQKLLTALASLINTNDELVGNAVHDSIAGEYHDGYNWVVKGEKDVTNGWIKLEMR